MSALLLPLSMDNAAVRHVMDPIDGANLWLEKIHHSDERFRKTARERAYWWLMQAGYSKAYAYVVAYP